MLLLIRLWIADMIRIPKNLSTNFSKQVNSFRFATRFRTHPDSAIKRLQQIAFSYFAQYRYCWLCQEQFTPSPPSFRFCPACQLDLPRNIGKCSQCALPLILSNTADTKTLTCGECITQPPCFSYTVASFRYEFPVRELIHRMKYQKQRYWIKALASQLIMDVGDAPFYKTGNLPELLVPVPLHHSRQKQRTFNQAGLLTRQLSKALAIPYRKDVLVKIEATCNQAKLNKAERIHNLKKSLAISKRRGIQETITGKHIALIDDVMTTKATAELAAKCLIDAGASRVDVWCLARTPKFRNND